MALKDELTKDQQQSQQGQQGDQLTDEDEKDLEICVLLAKHMIDDGGADAIKAALKSKDPGQVVGQFLMQLGSQLHEMLPEGMKPNPAIMLAAGGWLEQISDFLQEDYDVPRDVADRAEIYVAQSAQQMRDGAQQQAAGGAVAAQQGTDPTAAQQPPMPGGI